MTRPRWFFWWYLAIAAGFLLLGISRLLQGSPRPHVALRWLVAAGFLLLAWFEFRYGGRGRGKQ